MHLFPVKMGEFFQELLWYLGKKCFSYDKNRGNSPKVKCLVRKNIVACKDVFTLHSWFVNHATNMCSWNQPSSDICHQEVLQSNHRCSYVFDLCCSSSEPHLYLRVDLKPFSESAEVEEWVESPVPGPVIESRQARLQGLIMNQVLEV